MPTFRVNVCAVILNNQSRVLLAERLGGGWQFPQGGVKTSESPLDAIFREVKEEVNINEADLEVVGRTELPLEYTIPSNFQPRLHERADSIDGQRQWWYLLRFFGHDSTIDLHASDKPEFKQWRWVSYWHALHMVIEFKRNVYRRGLTELAALLNSQP